MKLCPISISLFASSAAAYTLASRRKKSSAASSSTSDKMELPKCQVIFVLGGPGSGKGTQCSLLHENLGWAHLSAGDLLRAERNKTDSEVGALINSKIASGQIVPSEITVSLLEIGMKETYANTGATKFLIDGFPRSQGNVTAWEEILGKQHSLKFVLVLDCPEQVLESRLLERGKSSGRVDDNMDVIRKRFKTFQEESYPIIQQYNQKGMVRTIVADWSVDDVYKEVSSLFEKL